MPLQFSMSSVIIMATTDQGLTTPGTGLYSLHVFSHWTCTTHLIEAAAEAQRYSRQEDGPAPGMKAMAGKLSPW